MPSKYPVLTPKEIIKVLEKSGFYFVSQKGSHIKYSNGTNKVIIPNHKEVKKATLSSILLQAGIDLDTFLEVLN
jgi:predicted RNA binding protein YcfA (HicA-like mRNA interferase family)